MAINAHMPFHMAMNVAYPMSIKRSVSLTKTCVCVFPLESVDLCSHFEHELSWFYPQNQVHNQVHNQVRGSKPFILSSPFPFLCPNFFFVFSFHF